MTCYLICRHYVW